MYSGVVVAKSAASVRVKAAKKSVAKGKKVRVAVTVSAPGYVPAGKVRIYDGSKVLGTTTLKKGVHTFSFSSRKSGKHTLTVPTSQLVASFGQSSVGSKDDSPPLLKIPVQSSSPAGTFTRIVRWVRGTSVNWNEPSFAVDAVRAKRSKHLPEVLSREEVKRLLAVVEGTTGLMLRLM